MSEIASKLFYLNSNHKIIILFLAIPFLALVIDFFLSRSLFGHRYRIFVAPGVVAHELAHAFACLATGAKIHSVALFEKQGGKVEHYRSRITVFGPIFISLAPLLAGAALIYFLAQFIGFQPINTAGSTLSFDEVKNIGFNLVQGINFSSYRTWVLIYLLFSLAVTMNPSLADLKNIFFSLVAVGLVCFLIYRYTSIRVDIAHYLPVWLVTALFTIDILLLFGLIFSIVVFVISKAIKPV